MKAGPVFAMIGLILLGMWLVLQPTLERSRRIDASAHRFELRLGSSKIGVEQRQASTGAYEYHFVGIESMESQGWVDEARFAQLVDERLRDFDAKPAFERTLMGMLNISSWTNALWVAVGLGGQIAFFGRMLIQWVVSENRRESVVPEIFWWFSFVGGVCLFTYFVWRVDIVGVLGQSTGVVIYARNLRLIRKQRRRRAREAERGSDQGSVVASGA